MPTINTINEATATVNQIEILTQAIKHLLSAPENYAILIPFVLWVFLNKNFLHVIELFKGRDKRKIERIDNYFSKSEHAEKTLLTTMHDIRNSLYFKAATGITAEKKFREILIKLHSDTSHKITWKKIQRAIPFIEINQNDEITIRRFRKFEVFTIWYNIFSGSILVLAAAFSLGAFFLIAKITLLLAVLCVILAIFFTAAAAFVFAQNWPEEAAREIKNELKLNTISAKGIEGYKTLTSKQKTTS